MSGAEKFIEEHTRNCSNLMQVPTLDDKGNIVPEAHPWLTPDQARKAVEIARTEIYEWLRAHSEEYVYWMDEEFGKEDLVNGLKAAMKDE